MDDHLWHYLESPSGKFRYRNHTNILILSWSKLIIHIQSCLNKSKISCRIPSLLILSKLASNAHSTVNTAQENENHFRKHVIWFVYAAFFRSAKSVKRVSKISQYGINYRRIFGSDVASQICRVKKHLSRSHPKFFQVDSWFDPLRDRSQELSSYFESLVCKFESNKIYRFPKVSFFTYKVVPSVVSAFAISLFCKVLTCDA